MAGESSGEEAVTYLKTHRVDLLVLDMIMDPGMDGLETYQKVLEINPKQKAIIVSGFSETHRVREAQELGAGAYVRNLISWKRSVWRSGENWIDDELELCSISFSEILSSRVKKLLSAGMETVDQNRNFNEERPLVPGQ